LKGGTSIDGITRVDGTFVACLTLRAYVDKNTSYIRFTSVVCAHVVIIACYFSVDTTIVRITRVICALIVIITINQSIDTLTSGIITRVSCTEIIIITIDLSKDTSNCTITSVNSA